MKQATISAIVIGLLLVPSAAASDGNDDGDPIGDDAEHLACGSAPLRLVLESLDGAAGECTDDSFEYSHDAFGDPVTCDTSGKCQTQIVVQTGIPVNDEILVPSFPLPPIEIPSIDPPPVGPFGTEVATLEGFKREDPEGYCVHVTTIVGPPQPPTCINSGLLHQLGPDTGVLSFGEVPEQDPDPTPGFEEGDLGDSPGHREGATTLDVEVVAYWVEDRLFPYVEREDGIEVWTPVDPESPSDVQWWAGNGKDTRIEVHWVWRNEDGGVIEEDTQSIDYLGQVYAALARSP